MTTALSQSLAALEAAEPARALDALLTAWRSCPDPRVADLVDAVSARALAASGAVSSPWKARKKPPSATEVAAMLATLTDAPKVGDIGDRVAALGKLAADPRVAARYVEMFRAPPFTASSHKPIWTDIFRQLEAVHVDARTRAAVAALAPKYTLIFGDTVMGQWMQTKLGKLAGAPSPKAPTSPETREIDAIGRWIAAHTAAPAKAPAVTVDDERAHLDAIAAAPRDEAPREAYRAWLAARGDPRAEFIDLQRRRDVAGEALSPTDTARMAALQKKHVAAWLGPLAPVVGDPRFARGFLVECTLTPKGTKTGPAVGDPRWATVETLHSSWKKDYGREVILHPVMRGLRALRGAPDDLVRRLLADPTPRDLEVLDTEAGLLPRELPATTSAPGLTRLREFTISCWLHDDAVSKYTSTWHQPGGFGDFLRSPLACRLKRLVWNVHETMYEPLGAVLDAHAPPAFTAAVDTWYLVLRRAADGRWRDVEVVFADGDQPVDDAKTRLNVLCKLDPAWPARIVVRAAFTEGLASLAPQLATVRARFPHAEVVLP